MSKLSRVSIRQTTVFPFLVLTTEIREEDQVFDVSADLRDQYEAAVTGMQEAELDLLESLAGQLDVVIRTVPKANDRHARNLRGRALQLNNRIVELKGKLGRS